MSTPLDIAFSSTALSGTAADLFKDDKNSMFSSLFREQGADLSPDSGLALSWDERSMPKKAAGFTTADGRAAVSAGGASSLKMSPMADIKLKRAIPAARVLNSRAPGELGDSGERYIEQQLKEMVQEIKLSEELLASGALKGNVSVSSATVPGTQVSFSLSFGVTNSTSSASWATNSTAITKEIEAHDDAMYAASRMTPHHYIIGRNVKGYLQTNNGVSNIFTAGDAMAQALNQMAAVIGPKQDFDFAGKAWAVNTKGYDVNGSLTRWLDDDQIITLPEDLSGVLGYGEGYCEIPARAFGGADVCELSQQRGITAYIVASHDPVGYELYVVHRALFVLLNPAAVGVYDCTP